jgi:hypothetical protein
LDYSAASAPPGLANLSAFRVVRLGGGKIHLVGAGGGAHV